MVGKRDGMLPNQHFRKAWERRIRTWFDQPMRKERRHANRVEKARRVAPRPVEKLRPVVRCPTVKYNSKVRLGRGFTIEELKAAGISAKLAPTIGISVDHRRANKSVEALQTNVQRLKEYRSRMILFPLRRRRPHKGDSAKKELKMAQQVAGVLMPLKGRNTRKQESPRVPTDQEKKRNAFHTLRTALAHKRLLGKRIKMAKARAERASTKTKK